MAVTTLLMIFMRVTRHGVRIRRRAIMLHVLTRMIHRWRCSITDLSMLAERHCHASDCRNRQPQRGKHDRKESQPTHHALIVGEQGAYGKGVVPGMLLWKVSTGFSTRRPQTHSAYTEYMAPKSDSRLGIPTIIALLLAALWLLAGYQIYAQRERVIANKEVELGRLVIAIEEQSLRLFKLTEATVITASRWIEQHPGRYPGQDPTFIDLATNLRRLSDDSLEIRIVDKAGGAHLVPAPTRQPVANLAGREHFRVQQNPQTRGLFLSDPVLSQVNRQWVIPVSYPISGGAGEFSAIAAAIQVDRLIPSFEAQRHKPDGSITLIKTNGITLLRVPAIEGSIGKSIAQAPDFIGQLNAKPRGVYRVKGAFDGVERLVGHARLSGYPVIVAVTASLDDVLAPWRDELRRITLLMALVTVAAIFFAARFHRNERMAHDLLARSEHRFRTLIDHAPDAIIVVDVDMERIIDANPRAESLFQRTRDELLSGGVERFYAPMQPDGLPMAASIQQVRERAFRGESVVFERRLLRSTGAEITVETRVDDMSENGRRLLRASFIDITERKQAEQAIKDSEARLRLLVETSPLPMIVATPPPEGRVILLNQRFIEVLGYSVEDIPDLEAWWPRAYPDSDERKDTQLRWEAAVERMIASGSRSLLSPFNVEVSCKDGSRRYMEIHMSVHANRCMVVFNDLTERRDHDLQLQHIAHFDALTGLPNRRLLTDRMDQTIARSRRNGKILAVCYLDLDQFKPVNDRYGHEAGDRVLAEVAARTTEAIRAEDTAARLGGDEFVLLLVDLESIDECRQVLNRVIASLATPFDLGHGNSATLSASIGVAVFSGGDDTADTLMRNADQAMYAAKHGGRNRLTFFAGLPSSETGQH
jgi:diguanylate cyclase (GGDEF)-like protein/PAS domain S-box-containing protein